MKHKHICTLTAALSVAVSSYAQSIYDAERMATSDLNGTARFVSMGGAMSALGADISTMSTNPAGIGLLRRSEVSVSVSAITQLDGVAFDNHGKTSISFDQAGFVYSSKLYSEAVPFLNLGFNYRKLRNFRNLINGATNVEQLTGGSQHASMTWAWAEDGAFWANRSKDAFSETTAYGILTPAAYLGYRVGLIAHDPASTPKNNAFLTQNAYDHTYNQWTTGGISQYDANISTTINDRVFLGLTFSAYDVRRTSYAAYLENYIFNSGEGQFHYRNEEVVSGHGYNIKLGAIVRPIASSPLRFGVSITTPTWYDITASRVASIANYKDQRDVQAWHKTTHTIDFYFRTPWKFNLSVGSTIDDYLAFGVEYEYSNLQANHYSYTGEVYDVNEPDLALNSTMDTYLQGQSTWRLGAELKVTPQLAIRGGYNHVTAPIKETAFLDQEINSYSINHITNPAYINLGAINRYTCGVGYRGKNFYADLSYQHQVQSGMLYSFYAQDQGSNVLPGNKIKLDKSQVMLTLGVRF